MRIIPQDFDQDRLAEIDRRLEAIEVENSVALPIAIESGSRAWGFPSPDSDYDVRFVYVRRSLDYLSPWTPRDVIETPIEGDMDINGWDLGKALRLMLKGNAVVLEWLQSPIVYNGDQDFVNGMLSLANEMADRQGLARHYFHLGTRQWNTYFTNGNKASIKKLFYVARPALALRWLRTYPSKKVPPMNFQKLLEESDCPAEITSICERLISEKSQTKEMGIAPVPTQLKKLVENEFQLAEASIGKKNHVKDTDLKHKTARYFYDIVSKYDQISNR